MRIDSVIVTSVLALGVSATSAFATGGDHYDPADTCNVSACSSQATAFARHTVEAQRWHHIADSLMQDGFKPGDWCGDVRFKVRGNVKVLCGEVSYPTDECNEHGSQCPGNCDVRCDDQCDGDCDGTCGDQAGDTDAEDSQDSHQQCRDICVHRPGSGSSCRDGGHKPYPDANPTDDVDRGKDCDGGDYPKPKPTCPPKDDATPAPTPEPTTPSHPEPSPSPTAEPTSSPDPTAMPPSPQPSPSETKTPEYPAPTQTAPAEPSPTTTTTPVPSNTVTETPIPPKPDPKPTDSETTVPPVNPSPKPTESSPAAPLPTVTLPPPADEVPHHDAPYVDHDALANTGSNLVGPLTLGALMLAAGGTALYAARRAPRKRTGETLD